MADAPKTEPPNEYTAAFDLPRKEIEKLFTSKRKDGTRPDNPSEPKPSFPSEPKPKDE